jgi:hypothetical protein
VELYSTTWPQIIYDFSLARAVRTTDRVWHIIVAIIRQDEP